MVLLTNAGVISRGGPHRINVLLARRFAAIGLRSLRWDMSGLGDSGRPSSTLPMREQFIADTRAAMDEAQRMCGVSRFVMIGFCSGAESAYHTALRDQRLVGILLFDLFTYPTWRTHLLRAKHRIRRFGFLSAMRRLTLAIARHLLRRRLLISARGGESPSTTPSREEFAARLSELHHRGTRVLILHSAESELHNYEEQFRDNFQRFGIIGKIDYAYLRECDHGLTTAEGQRSLVSTAVEWVQRLQATEMPSRSCIALGRVLSGEGQP
jgi:pimeloyl-ACP methyl ester carboxylesterase